MTVNTVLQWDLSEKPPNNVRNLRKALGLNQTQFAMALEMSIASVQNYERGSQPSDGALEKMQRLAADRGLVEIGFALKPKPFAVRKVVGPEDAGKRIRLPNSSGKDFSESMHETLDFVIEHADSETVATLEALLNLVRRTIRSTK